jgi:hypothetical protein
MPQKSSAFVHGDAFFAECQVVETFIGTSARPIVERAMDRSRVDHATYLGTLLRITAWLRSLGKLNHPGDFQPVSFASRALFEIAVDLTLLQCDPKHHPHALIMAWEESAKLKQAEAVVRHFKKPPKQPAHVEAFKFKDREGDRINALRLKFWPSKNQKPKHPDRWTGRNLPDDAARADRVAGFEFSKFYAERFSYLCWNTHGSGLAGVRTLTEQNFPAMSALAFAESARFAVIGTDLILRVFEKHDAITEARYRRLEADRKAARADVILGYPVRLWHAGGG